MFSKIISNTPHTILLETTLATETESRNFLFQKPADILEAYTLSDLENALNQIEEYLKMGYYLAGYISYEAGYLFERQFQEAFQSIKFPFPLIWFGVYPRENVLTFSHNVSLERQDLSSFTINQMNTTISRTDYIEKVERILAYIRNGHTYQVNFTLKTEFDFLGDAFDLYESLKINQPVSYSAFINDGKRKILSLSPELFLKIKNGIITARPMKGTVNRGKSELDEHNVKAEFSKNEKIKSENSIIVDLIRNDLGKIAKLGSVSVPKLLKIEEYKTLFQMTSTVQAKLKPNLSFLEILKAMFPGGSVTGAPKKRTMEIIRELETNYRGVYTGAIGFLNSEEAIFNLPIRTVVLEDGKGIIGIGSGIIADSNPEEEFDECLLKQKFLLQTIIFKLIETILFRRNTFYSLDLHLKRLQKSATFFGFNFDLENIKNELYKYRDGNLKKNSFSQSYKIRIVLARDGSVEIEHSFVKVNKEVGKIKFCPERISSLNLFQNHKTTLRDFYNQNYKKAQELNLTDYIYLNEKEEVTEGSIYNVFIKQGKDYFTPPLASGALAGVMREYLINKNILKEKTLTTEDLRNADKIFLCNSVRGIMRVILEK